jgi:Xaa-Pro aminopeptidase
MEGQMSITREKVEQAIGLLNEFDLDIWVTFARESANNPDPVLDLIYGTSCTWHSAFIITRSGRSIALVGSLEVANTKDTGAYEEVIGYLDGIKDDLLKVLNAEKPKKIAINYSENSVMADGLSHGMWLTLTRYLEGTEFAERLVPSEQIISALRGRKSGEELRRLRDACKVTEEILATVTDFLKPGVTEIEVADFVKNQVTERGLELSWDPTHCPAVFTGPDSAGAHAGPTDRKVERGHIVNLDFGIKIEDYCADLQRTWYVLKEGETEAPAAVMKGFNTIVEAIQLGAEAVKPGATGLDVDNVVRGHVTGNGFEEYPHGTGHQVGRAAHDGGALLAPEWERYGNIPHIPLEVGNVFTIEPRLTVERHGIATCEEEVIITEDGCEFLSTPQRDIFLVK